MARTVTRTKPAHPAKRGDLVLMPHTVSASYEINPYRHIPERTEYVLAKVASVSREGHVNKAERPTGWPSVFGYDPRAMVLPAARLNEAADVVLNTHAEPFATVAAAQAALLRYVLAAA